jgi:hypothetical protein
VWLVKYWVLGAACVLWGVIVALVRHVDPAVGRWVMFATYLVPAIACTVAALSYGPRDRLRWAWFAFAAGYAIAFVSKTIVGDLVETVRAPDARQLTWSLFILAFNVCTVIAPAIFASVWSGTGVAPPWRRWATLGFFLLAILIAIPQGHVVLGLMATRKPIAIGGVASLLGDISSITLIGPIFATMIALRGGVLARTWIFLFLSVSLWLLNNLSLLLPPTVSFVYDGVVRGTAMTLTAAAAVAQLWVQREVRASLPD